MMIAAQRYEPCIHRCRRYVVVYEDCWNFDCEELGKSCRFNFKMANQSLFVLKRCDYSHFRAQCRKVGVYVLKMRIVLIAIIESLFALHFSPIDDQ